MNQGRMTCAVVKSGKDNPPIGKGFGQDGNSAGDLKIIMGEVGWPTDGNINADTKLAQTFHDETPVDCCFGKTFRRLWTMLKSETKSKLQSPLMIMFKNHLPTTPHRLLGTSISCQVLIALATMLRLRFQYYNTFIRLRTMMESGDKIKATAALNADVHESSSNKPPDGNIRNNIKDVTIHTVKFLRSN
ncbi:hypothetical protein NC652_022396 [Populus alba x Populus x berolinensis]|nr:hypothetical protein NC652_022396 [Populus alba x Populus x berolinensis]